MYVCTCICISFLIAVCGTLFFNSQNFYAMNDVFLFLHVFAKFLWMYFISVSSCLYIPSFMYLPPYIVATITFLPFRNETLHLMTRYQSNLNQDWLWGNLYNLREFLCMWPAIFLIDPDALIILRTWYVLNECLKICHI